MAYHPPSAQRSGTPATVPSFQALFGGTAPLRIPKPSELFGLHPGLSRPPAHPTLQRVSPPTGISEVLHLPPPGQLTAAGVTRQREHDRRLRAMGKRLNRAQLKRRLEAQTDPNNNPVEFLSLGTPPHDATSPGWGGVFSGLRQWYADRQHQPIPTEQDVGVHLEFDTDVVDALVYTVGRWLGLNAEQLRDSPGLRTLVSRNIEWFRSSPDWLKLTGLVLAKKLNQSLDCPPRQFSNTQRMLLDRMLQNTNEASRGEGEASTEVSATTPPSEETTPAEIPPVTVPSSKTKKPKKPTKQPKSKPVRTKATSKQRKPTTKKPSKPLPGGDPPAKKPRRSRTSKLRSLLTDPAGVVSIDTDPREAVSVDPSDPIDFAPIEDSPMPVD